jgi:hypothetical protein
MKYDYGDEVILKAANDSGVPVDTPGAVVGITEVQSSKQAEAVGFPIGTVLYTVELGDGSDQLVPEDRLAPLLADEQR